MCAQGESVREKLLCDVQQDREGVENGQDVETLEREEEFNGWRDNAQSDT